LVHYPNGDEAYYITTAFRAVIIGGSHGSGDGELNEFNYFSQSECESLTLSAPIRLIKPDVVSADKAHRKGDVCQRHDPFLSTAGVFHLGSTARTLTLGLILRLAGKLALVDRVHNTHTSACGICSRYSRRKVKGDLGPSKRTRIVLVYRPRP
jgi:hypothetical protein